MLPTRTVPPDATGTPPHDADAQDNIREVVFRYQIGGDYGQDAPRTYCLSVGSSSLQKPADEYNEPSQKVMTALKMTPPSTPILPDYMCNRSSEGVTDAVGGCAIIPRVHTIAWVSDTEAQVEGGYYMSGQGKAGIPYQVVLEGNKWVVKDEQVMWSIGVS